MLDGRAAGTAIAGLFFIRDDRRGAFHAREARMIMIN